MKQCQGREGFELAFFSRLVKSSIRGAKAWTSYVSAGDYWHSCFIISNFSMYTFLSCISIRCSLFNSNSSLSIFSFSFLIFDSLAKVQSQAFCRPNLLSILRDISSSSTTESMSRHFFSIQSFMLSKINTNAQTYYQTIPVSVLRNSYSNRIYIYSQIQKTGLCSGMLTPIDKIRFKNLTQLKPKILSIADSPILIKQFSFADRSSRQERTLLLQRLFRLETGTKQWVWRRIKEHVGEAQGVLGERKGDNGFRGKEPGSAEKGRDQKMERRKIFQKYTNRRSLDVKASSPVPKKPLLKTEKLNKYKACSPSPSLIKIPLFQPLSSDRKEPRQSLPSFSPFSKQPSVSSFSVPLADPWDDLFSYGMRLR